MSSSPLISCVCVTRAKPAMLSRVIRCFWAQTYQNKEMIIIYEEDDISTDQFVGNPDNISDNIRIFKIPATQRMSLGALRNEGVSLANGEFVCQWDDDDWYHMNRLTCQYYALSQEEYDGCIMTRWLVFDAIKRKAYVSNRRRWEGSIMCRKEMMQQTSYENVSKGEDTAVVDYLAATECLHYMEDAPGLYIYIYHGGNTWHQAHWEHIFECSTALRDKASDSIYDILNGEYTVETASLMVNELLEKEIF